MNERLKRLNEQLTAITDKVSRESRSHLTPDETRRFKEIKAEVLELRTEVQRSGRNDPVVREVLRSTTLHSAGPDWATRAAAALRTMNGPESRAVNSGSVDLATLIEPSVTAKARPTRLIDLLVNRRPVPSNAFEYFRQTVRTNNATAVADSATKPTSVLTVAPINDRCRVIAHLSQPVPIRLWQDAAFVIQWLDVEMREGVTDALEAQVISGSGSGENMTGVLNVAGTTQVAFATDIPTTLRKSITALQVLGIVPNALVVNPADAEAIDLTKEGTGGVGYLLDGFTNTNAQSGNVLGDVQRVISNSVPAGVAVLGDWNQVQLQVREEMRLDVDAGGDLFKTNEAILRAETRVGIAHLRPASFAIVDLTA